MKKCPQCNAIYNDASLNFCLEDGSNLVFQQTMQRDVNTVAFVNPPNSERSISQTNRDFPSGSKSLSTANIESSENIKSPGKSRMILVSVLLTLILASGIFYFSGALNVFYQGQDIALKNTPAASEPKESKENAVVIDSSNNNTANSTINEINSTEGVVATDVQNEIKALLSNWAEAKSNKDILKVAALYSETANFQDISDSGSVSFKERLNKLFTDYDDIEISLSEIVVAVGNDKNTATAVLDKQWSYEASGKLDDGKAHIKLHFERLSGEWKIVEEKIKKIYYHDN